LLLAGQAQAGPVEAANGRFIRLTSQQGLANDNVNAVLRDRVGFLWVGTDDGLSRYDGDVFTTFEKDDTRPNTLPDDYVAALSEDHAGRLLVGTEHGLCRFDRRTDTFPVILAAAVSAVVQALDGVVGVGARRDGWDRAMDRGA